MNMIKQLPICSKTDFFDELFKKDQIVILPPIDVNGSIDLIKNIGFQVQSTIIDPWYNKGIGGVRSDYVEFILSILNNSKTITNHLYLWGFPEIVALFVDKIPKPLEFIAWLTWYFKNTPSVIRGWRSSQQTCLHLGISEAKLFPQNFFNGEQKRRYKEKKMRFIPGPSSVIEEALLVGFVGKKEQTGHPAQKPIKVYEKLILMTTQEEDLVFDPMCGSGTTGEICRQLGRKAIISDISEEYIQICEERLGIKRVESENLREYFPNLNFTNQDNKTRTNIFFDSNNISSQNNESSQINMNF